MFKIYKSGYLQLSGTEGYLWECTWKHLDCLTSGMWGQMQILAKFLKNTHKRSNKIFATKPNGQIFTIKTPKASLS